MKKITDRFGYFPQEVHKKRSPSFITDYLTMDSYFYLEEILPLLNKIWGDYVVLYRENQELREKIIQYNYSRINEEGR